MPGTYHKCGIFAKCKFYSALDDLKRLRKELNQRIFIVGVDYPLYLYVFIAFPLTHQGTDIVLNLLEANNRQSP